MPTCSHLDLHVRTSPIRPLELDSMLLFLLCPIEGTIALSTASPAPFTDPSAVLLNPWVTGESSDMGLAAVSPVRGAFTASIRNGAFCTRDRARDGGTARSAVCFWAESTFEDEGDVKSVSATVDADRLLDDDGNWGAENVLDAADTKDSCESGSSRLYRVGTGAGWAAFTFSRGAVRECSFIVDPETRLTHRGGVAGPAVYHRATALSRGPRMALRRRAI